MEHDERTEVREMINDRIGLLGKDLDRRDILLLTSLNKIDKHLEQLNSKVASHEKTINENLPHTIIQCPQNETINLLKEALVGEGAVERDRKDREARDTIAKNLQDKKIGDRWQRVIWILMAVIAIGSIWVSIWISGKRDDKMATKIEAGQPATMTRGGAFFDPISGRVFLFDKSLVLRFDSIAEIANKK